MPVAVNHPTAVARDGRLYVHGGFTAAGALSDPTSALQEYQPDRNRWRRLPDSPTPRAAHALGVSGDRLYAAGGTDDTNAQLTARYGDDTTLQLVPFVPVYGYAAPGQPPCPAR